MNGHVARGNAKQDCPPFQGLSQHYVRPVAGPSLTCAALLKEVLEFKTQIGQPLFSYTMFVLL